MARQLADCYTNLTQRFIKDAAGRLCRVEALLKIENFAEQYGDDLRSETARHDAIEELERLVEEIPTDPRHRWLLARAYGQLGVYNSYDGSDVYSLKLIEKALGQIGVLRAEFTDSVVHAQADHSQTLCGTTQRTVLLGILWELPVIETATFVARFPHLN